MSGAAACGPLPLALRTPAAAAALLAALALSCAGTEGHDAAAPSHDVVVSADPGGAAGAPGYDYVAKRPLAVVALAEARGLDAAAARAAVDRLADSLDTCATEQGRRGTLVDGAARVAAQIDGDGNIAGTQVRFDPRPGVAENAALCFVAPVKMLTFGASDAGARGIALEALWGHVIPGHP